jgi:outer membrane receptor protein involved in Fe transport
MARSAFTAQFFRITMFKMIKMASAAALSLVAAHASAATDGAPIQPSSAPSSTLSSDAPPLPTSASAPSSASSSPVPAQLGRVEVRATRQRLDDARSSLSPDTGSTIYRFDKTDIDKLPQGNATPLNQVILRAPGVVGDSYGQVHVRGDHANLQYRINGVVIPESISGFGQSLDTRFADQVNVLTGALPAQYGYRTAGVVDIRTKGADLANAGSIDAVFGSRGHRETSVNVGGTEGDLQYFVTGSYLQNQIGIENPTASFDAIHDETRQTKGFAYLSYLLGQSSRVSLMLGSANNQFQIPNVAGQQPEFMLAGATPPSSVNLNANQRERSSFEVLSFQSSIGNGFDYQISLFDRTSSVHYVPDPVGDLTYNGVAADVQRRNVADGVQFDLSKQLSDQHTLRAGLFVQRERGSVSDVSTVFAANADGTQSSEVPLTISDNSKLGGPLLGVYLQDEWQPTKALTVNYGARYDKVNTVVDESQISPRLGVVYQLSEDTRAHAGYARYFTPPPTEKIDTTSVAKFAGTTNALPSDANTAVLSERSNYFDLGISHQLSKSITVGADAYYRAVQHLQDEGQFGKALIYSAFNYDQGRIYGLELSGSYREDRLSAYTNVSIESAMGKGIETGQFNFAADELAYIANHWVHLDHEQKLSASAGLSYRLGEASAVGSDALYGSGLRSGFANTEHLPGFVQLNASASHTFDAAGPGKFDVRLSVLNLLDKSYELRDGTGIGVGAPQFGPRRTIYLALSKPFTF